jgi:hypothetical protein
MLATRDDRENDANQTPQQIAFANGEQWVILHNQNGLGIQFQRGMPAAAAFETNIVIKTDARFSSGLSRGRLVGKQQQLKV